MSAESKVEDARLALAKARSALRTAEEAVDVLEAEVKTLRAVVQAPYRGRIDCVCQNPACGKAFTVRASDIRGGNKAGRYCSWPCTVAARKAGRARGVA